MKLTTSAEVKEMSIRLHGVQLYLLLLTYLWLALQCCQYLDYIAGTGMMTDEMNCK
jgi:hypothetical protein